MRYFIIFGVTLILLLFILFYNPYLGVYNDSITIKYDFDDEGYSWSYSIDNDCLVLKDNDNNSWKFVPYNNGKCKLVFKYSNEEDNKYTIEYKFKIKGKRIYWLDGVGYGLLDYPNPV